MAFVGIDGYLINPNNIILISPIQECSAGYCRFEIILLEGHSVGVRGDTKEETEKIYNDFVDKLAISQVK